MTQILSAEGRADYSDGSACCSMAHGVIARTGVKGFPHNKKVVCHTTKGQARLTTLFDLSWSRSDTVSGESESIGCRILTDFVGNLSWYRI